MRRVYSMLLILIGLISNMQQDVYCQSITLSGESIENQEIETPEGVCVKIHKLLQQFAIERSIRTNVMFRGNHFIQKTESFPDFYKGCYDLHLQTIKRSSVMMEDNRFDQSLVMTGVSGGVFIVNNSMPLSLFAFAKHESLHFSTNLVDSLFSVQQSSYHQVYVTFNVFKRDTSIVDITQSNINDVVITNNEAKTLHIKFLLDTLNFVTAGNLPAHFTPIISKTRADRKSKLGTINFHQCILRNRIKINDNNTGSGTVKFDQCSFDIQAHILDINVDTLEFNRCVKIERGMRIRPLSERSRPIILKFSNSDLTNIDFDYTDKFQLYQWGDEYQTKSVYEQLLAKFQNEKKLASYEKVDIEYFKFRNNPFVNTISAAWWNYGYNKGRVVLWTLFSLLVFTIINTFGWQWMRKTYPIDKNDHITNAKFAKRFVKIFIYTSLIFFSLRIDFDKLSFKRLGWLSYFFFQYTVGLLCLFFIVNWILKF